MLNDQAKQELTWKKFPILNDGFVCLVDVMGDDSSITQAARVSYGNDTRECPDCLGTAIDQAKQLAAEASGSILTAICQTCNGQGSVAQDTMKDRDLIRYLMRHRHSTPFEMAEVKLLVRVPMDCWRQWIRHRTANVNEYSTRYSEAIDSQQTTKPEEWRQQAKDNKQGSAEGPVCWPEGRGSSTIYVSSSENEYDPTSILPSELLTEEEERFQKFARRVYEERLRFGIAKEQARKDLPLSTYTEAYWKCDLHNILHFLALRMDSHAQKEIRDYATIVGQQIIKPLFPLVWEAFEDYRLNAMVLTGPEITLLSNFFSTNVTPTTDEIQNCTTLGKREKSELITKLERLGLL